MARFYGGGLESVERMPWVDVVTYGDMIEKLSGEERREQMIVAAYPNMEKGDRERTWRAFGSRKGRAKGPEEVAKAVAEELARRGGK